MHIVPVWALLSRNTYNTDAMLTIIQKTFLIFFFNFSTSITEIKVEVVERIIRNIGQQLMLKSKLKSLISFTTN